MKLQSLVAILGLLCLPLVVQGSANSPTHPASHTKLDGLVLSPETGYPPAAAPGAIDHSTAVATRPGSASRGSGNTGQRLRADGATWVLLLGGIVIVAGTLREYEKWT